MRRGGKDRRIRKMMSSETKRERGCRMWCGWLYLWWVPNMISSFACKEQKNTQGQKWGNSPEEVITPGIPEKVSHLDKVQPLFSIGANFLSALHGQPREDTSYNKKKRNA